MKPFLLRLVACLFVVVSSSSHAALYDRGNGLIYDDVLDITWLQDANYAQTSDWATTNQQGELHTPDNVQSDGRMSWHQSKIFAEGLIYQNHSNWRLPSILDSPNQVGYNITDGELGYMFYENLNGSAQETVASNLFSNLIDGPQFWYEETSPWLSNERWYFNFNNGSQHNGGSRDSRFVWPVHDGDIGASQVPLPAGIYLFLSGLVGLVGAKLRGRNA